MLTLAKRIFWTIFLSCLLIFSFPLSSFALTPEEIPNPRQDYGGWVTDMAQILTQQTERQLNRTINLLESKTSDEIAVVTVPTTAPAETPKAFTTELFNRWGIGKKEGNNGVLVLISASDRRIEIETGYGLEKILPDALVNDIIKTQMIPYFKQEKFDEGAIAGVNTIIDYLDASITTSANKKLPVTGLLLISGILILVLFVMLNAYNLARDKSPTTRQQKQSSKNNASASSDWSSYDWGSSSGDSGSFGGGDSGGGGGDW